MGFLVLLVGSGCAPSPVPEETLEPTAGNTKDERDMETGPLVIFLGDSLTAGYGLSEAEAFPALLTGQLRGRERVARIVNAGISGDTTAGGLARVDWLLSQDPEVMVVELGANDGLRGLALEETRKNLDEIVRRCLGAGARVLVIGMKIPPSYGPEYSSGFEDLFADLATAHGVSLMPFLLEGVAADPDLNQSDGIHPNAAGQRLLAENVLDYVQPILDDL